MGTLVSIFTTPQGGEELASQNEAVLEVGVGIVGDRYATKQGTFSKEVVKDEEQVTLIELEEIHAYNRTINSDYPHDMFRRNLVTKNVRLNDLVGKEFFVGECRLLGIELCEPCNYLTTYISDVLNHMMHKGGLRAKVLEGGSIRPQNIIKT